MPPKLVSFTESEQAPGNFQTFPKPILKEQSTSPTSNAGNPPPKEDLEKQVSDLYLRYLSPQEVDIERLLYYVLGSPFNNPLISYSVLNWLLKAAFETRTQQEQPIKLKLTAEDACAIMERASLDLLQYNNSVSVVDARIIPQIIRVIEAVWAKISESESMFENCKEIMQEFSVNCISIIATKYNSKAIMNSMTRICDYAIDHKFYSTKECEQMVNSLCKSNLVASTNFQSELISLLVNISAVFPEAMVNCERSWIPLAVRCGASYNAKVREQAVYLLNTVNSMDSVKYISLCLDETSESRKDSEELGRYVIKRLMPFFAIPSDDVRSALNIWLLILKSSLLITPETSQWRYLEAWEVLLRMSFKGNPRTTAEIWPDILSLETRNMSYKRLLTSPIHVAPIHPAPGVTIPFSHNLTLNRVLKDAVNSLDAANPLIWTSFLKPAMDILLSRSKESSFMTSFAIQIWRQCLQRGLLMDEKFSEDYIELMGKLFRPNSNATDIWTSVISSFKSRNSTMELIRFHYKLLSQESTTTLQSWAPTTLFLNHLDFQAISERPKNHNYSLLTLLLLPIVTFLKEDLQLRYLEKLVSSKMRTETDKFKILDSLVATLSTTHENLEPKWMCVSRAVSTMGPGMTKVVHKLLQEFPFTCESEDLWDQWSQLFSTLPKLEGESVLTKLTSLRSMAAFKAVASIDGYEDARVKLICAVLKPENCIIFRNHANSSQFVDTCARYLISRGTIDKLELALNLVPEQRTFVVAKHLIESLNGYSRTDSVVSIWNSKIITSLIGCPSFISQKLAAELNERIPKMKIPNSLIISEDVSKPADDVLVTPPPVKKRKRTILTGSVPQAPSVLTPPPSDFNTDDTLIQQDDLSSSPPPSRASPLKLNAIKNTNDRVTMLKRAMMGLDMEEAGQHMKRSEKEMIYSLMFRSCVWLKTNLSESSDTIGTNELDEAKENLKNAQNRLTKLQNEEYKMIESGKKRIIDDDSSSAASSEEESDDDEAPFKMEIKNEIV